jgi:16S rRNA (guanine966-N2)-methyltransferase
MRISGGLAKGISLRVTKTTKLRPATDANRERLFSSLGDFVREKSVLDLFAGSGSYGLESLSRGAGCAVFVESDRRIFRDLKQNLANTCKSANLLPRVGRLENRDVIEYLRHCDASFDLVFLDPPYSEFANLGSSVLELLRTRNLINTDSLLVHESPPEETKDFSDWSLVRTLGKEKKGSPSLRIYKLSGPASGQ